MNNEEFAILLLDAQVNEHYESLCEIIESIRAFIEKQVSNEMLFARLIWFFKSQFCGDLKLYRKLFGEVLFKSGKDEFQENQEQLRHLKGEYNIIRSRAAETRCFR